MALKAGRVGVNPNYVDKEGRPLYDNSYLKELLRKEGIITLFTKEGNPISIDNAVEGHLYSCIVTLSPKQAGTGDPSPTNVRAITGYDTLKITANNVDTDYSFEDTVYGGVLDVNTGVFTIDKALIVYDGSEDENWGGSQLTTVYRAGIGLSNAVNDKGASNYLPYVNNWASDTEHFYIYNNAVYAYIAVDGLASFKEYLSEHNLQIWYELATPTTVQLSPAQIALVTGSNTVSSTTGTSLDIQYLGTLVPGGANGRSLNRSLNLNREVIDGEEKKEIQEEVKEEIKEEVPVEEPVTVKKSTKKSTK